MGSLRPKVCLDTFVNGLLKIWSIGLVENSLFYQNTQVVLLLSESKKCSFQNKNLHAEIALITPLKTLILLNFSYATEAKSLSCTCSKFASG
jgi:hypothetical protein